MTHRTTAEPETPSTLGFDQQTPLKPPLANLQHGSTRSNDGPSEALLEFRIHPWRLLVASVVLSAILLIITIALESGFVLDSVAPDESLSWSLLRSQTISAQIDELNSYSGNAASALGALWTFALQLIVYVLVLAIVPALMIDNSSMWARVVLLYITGGITWLAIQGFVATNVQLKPLETIPVLSFADLNGFNRDLMVNFQNYTPSIEDPISNPQSSTSTLLRTAIAGTYPRETVACSLFPEGDHSVSVSFGFSNYDWLRCVMPNGSTETTSATLVMNASSEDELIKLPMGQTNATSLAIFALEMTDSFFGVDTTVNTTHYEALWEEFGNQATEETDGFLGVFQQLMRSTLSDEKNYFQHLSTKESTIAFTQTNLSDQIMFDAVTFEIPLKRNFFSRTLGANINTSSDGSSSTLTYTSTPNNLADDEDAIYEMAVWEDCTPNGCMLSGGLPEVNSEGVETHPDSQVMAVRICLDADGNEDPLETLGGCQYGHSLNSFLVFSVASRIEGDSMNIDNEDESTKRRRRLQSDDSESGSLATATASTADGSSTAMSSSGTGKYSFPSSSTYQDIPDNVASSSSADDSSSIDGAVVPEDEIPGGDPTTKTPSQTPSSMSIRLSTSAPVPTTTISSTKKPGIIVHTTKPPTTQKPKIKLQAAKVFSFEDIPGSSSLADGNSSGDDYSSGDDSSSSSDDALISDSPIEENEIPGGDPTTTNPSQTPSSMSIRLSTSAPVPTTTISSTKKPGIIVHTTKPPTTKKPKVTIQAVKAFSFAAKAASATSEASSSAATSASSTSQSTNYSLSAAASSELASALTRKAYLKNARKIYTVTVGRMSWKLEDLAERFGARCNVTHNRDCQGLTFELTNSSQRLVVGQQYLPLANLREYSGSSYLWTPLAKIKRDSGFGGDFAFKNAFTESNWPEDLNGTACKSSREEYIVSSLDNHLYSQHSFQPAYTASLMWLFQYGTANDIIDLDHSRQSLAFVSNIIRSGVVMSTPSNSSYLTYGACVLVVGLTFVVSLMARRQCGVRPTRTVRTRTVAEVLLKENQYPPLFVKCYVHPPDQEPSFDVDPSITIVRDAMEPLHSYNLQGLELQRNASSQWLSDRPTESV